MATTADPASRTPERVGGYAPIRDYAVIGNKRTAALVALDGAIDWLCLPGYSRRPTFGALLDATNGGAITLRPAGPFRASRRYVEDTNVLETTFVTADGTVRVTDAMSWPAAHVLLWNQVIRRIDGIDGQVPMTWSVLPRFGFEHATGECDRRAGLPVIVHGDSTIAIEPFDVGEPEPDPQGGGYRGRFDARAGETAVLAINAFEDEPLTRSSRDELLSRVDQTAVRWRTRMERCAYEGPWEDAVRRSALTLDLLIDAQTGATVAAPTMGLPERIGGPRNFDYRYTWVRDGNLTLEAMQRLGFGDEVHTALAWMLHTVRRTRPRLRPMYAIDGDTRVPNQKLALPGYRGSQPVTLGNGAKDQLQLGNFGDIMDMTALYVRDGNAIATTDRDELAGIADHVCRIWQLPDASIWELSDEQQYTQGKLACWLALHHAAELADQGEIRADHAERWRAEADRIAEYIRERCWNPRLNAYARAADSDELDAGVLLAARGPFFENEPERLSTTIDAIREHLGAGGPLVFRYTGMGDKEGAFLACSFWIVEALARVGRTDEAHALMDELVALTSDVGLLSEEMDPGSGEFLGNVPLALSHLALVNAAFTLSDATS